MAEGVNQPQPAATSDKTKQGGANRTPYENYKELMDDSLNKIAKTVSKSKNKDLIVLATKALGKFVQIGYVMM